MKNLATILALLVALPAAAVNVPYLVDKPTLSNAVASVASDIVNAVGGPTNGITATTGTNIAAYQALLATNNILSATATTNAAAYQASLATNGLVLTTNGAILYVSVAGNDATAVKGNDQKPWRTPSFAATNANSGDSIVIWPGIYLETNYFQWRAGISNVTVSGSGPENTVLISTFANGFPYPVIPKMPGGRLYSLSISNALTNCNPSSCIGMHPNIGLPMIRDTDATRWEGANLWLWGGSDVDYNRGSNNIVNYTLRRSKLYGGWDISTMFGSTGDTNTAVNGKFFACEFYFVGETSCSGNHDTIVQYFNVYSTNEFFGCTFEQNASYNTYIAYGDQAGTGGGERCASRFVNCSFVNRGAGQASLEFGDGVGLFENCTGLKPAQFVNSAETADAATFGTNYVSRLSFGGDAVAGEKATITTGSGSPEGAVTAPVGSLYLRHDGANTTSLYVKTNGTGNTGWGGK